MIKLSYQCSQQSFRKGEDKYSSLDGKAQNREHSWMAGACKETEINLEPSLVDISP